MISESNCINIVEVSIFLNIFDIFSYGFDQNRSGPSKNLAPSLEFSPPNFSKIFPP